MDLENFPTSESAKRMLSYVTHGWYDKSYVGKWIYEVLGERHDYLAQIIGEMRLQRHVRTATWALGYWEELYGLPIMEGLSYEERRARILARQADKGPMNPERLRTMVEGWTGRSAEIKEKNDQYSFEVRILPSEEEGSIDVLGLIRNIDVVKPAHLGYVLVLCYQDRIDLKVGTAEAYRNSKRPVTDLEDPLLQLLYLEWEKRKVRPTAEAFAETVGLENVLATKSKLLKAGGAFLIHE